MKYFPLRRRVAVGILALCAASGSGALTLGRVQGIALIGRPLDISVPVLFEASGETVPECSDAQVYYGDTRLQAGRVTAQIESGGAGATVRVRAEPAINEPVVTIYLNVGCTNRSTRRLVLLSEQPDPRTEAATRPVPLAQSATAEPPRGTQAPAARPPRVARPAGSQGSSEANASAAGGTAAVAPRPPRATRPAQPVASAREAAGKNQPRLKLEPLDLSAPLGEPTLRMSDMMAAPQESANEQRALAGAMWRAMNARPEDLLREVQRLESLEQDLRSLRVSIQRNEQALTDVRGQLQKAESERYANPLVYGLALLALVAALAALWAWRRRGTMAADGSPWWRPGEDSPDSQVPSREEGNTVTRLSGPAPLQDGGPSAASATESRTARPEAPATPRPSADFSPSMRGDDFRASNSASLRALRAEELHDVQQEADFFISLGEFDRAIEVLRSHISMNPETSAVAWLDLMGIYHKLDRRHDYEWVRRQFQHNYNAEVPEFENYSDASPGLEAYENAMTRIVALWPSRRVLDVIEESIFRGPSSDGSNAFTLQAYRDLLLLHHIGTEVVGQEGDGRTSSFFGDLGQPPNFDPSNFSQTAISPLSSMTSSSEPWNDNDPEIGLDINLDEPSAADVSPISASHPRLDDDHLVDFDLPDMDVSGLKARKTRE